MKNIYSAQIKRDTNRELIWQGYCPDEIKDVINTKVSFGRYRDHTYEYIVNNDPRYITNLSYYKVWEVPSQIIDWAREHIHFRITYYMPLKGDINNLITKYMNRSLTTSYEYGDNYSKHELM